MFDVLASAIFTSVRLFSTSKAVFLVLRRFTLGVEDEIIRVSADGAYDTNSCYEQIQQT